MISDKLHQLFRLFFFLLFLNTNIFANIININSNTNNLSILEKSYLLMDENSTRTISEILNEEKDFTPFSNKFMNYGYRFKDTFWIKFSLNNNSNKDILKYLIFDSPNIDILNLYYFNKESKEQIIKSGIFNRKIFESELSFRFPLSLDSNESRIYYLEIKPITHSLHFTLKIKDYKTFKNDELHHQLILTIFFAILFVIISYNTLIYISTRNTIYIYYSFFILTLFIHHLHIRGMIAYFLPNSPQVFTEFAYIPIYNLSIVLIAMFLFITKFLNLQRYKKLYFGLKLFMVVIGIILIMHTKENYILNYLTPLALMFSLYVEFIGFYLFFKTNEANAKYFFIIWSISLGGMIGTMLYYVGVIPNAIPYLFEITVVIEVLLFSLVLANQIRTLQKDKLKKNIIIQEQSKMAAMGEMLQNIAHQWRQPLSEINAVAMKIDADYYRKTLTAEILNNQIQRIENITEHMSTTIESFNTYFNINKKVDETNVKEIMDKSLQIIEAKIIKSKINVEIDIHSTANITINSTELMQVILVILNNAIDVLNERSIENKDIYISYESLNKKHFLAFEDNAGGISSEIIDKIFEPYFSTKFKSNGIGIGLYMAKMLIEDSMKGKISASNTKNGAKFLIEL